MRLIKPNPFIKHAPYLRAAQIEFNPQHFERFIWLDTVRLFGEINTKIGEIEQNSGMMEPSHGGLVRIPQRPGSVFGIDASFLIGKLLEELLENGSYYDLAAILDTIENHFMTDHKDPHRKKYDELSEQFQELVMVHSGGIVRELIRLLSMSGYCNLGNSDYKWQMLGFRMEQALIGYGLINADGESQAIFSTY